MQIIAGCARGMELETPPGIGVRPTAARARKALFDSLGDWRGKRVLDLFAGSGALGLEAASRGAALLVAVELEDAHCRVLARNFDRFSRRQDEGSKTELKLLQENALNAVAIRSSAPFDFVFADPPYAQSAECFAQLAGSAEFRSACAGAKLVWEIPDAPGSTGMLLSRCAEFLTEFRVRRFGAAGFLIGEVTP